MLILFNSEQGKAIGNPEAIRYEKVTQLFPDPRSDGHIQLYAWLDSGRSVILCSEGSMDRIVERMTSLENSYQNGERIVDLRGTIKARG